MIVYVVIKYKGDKLKGVEVFKTLAEAGIENDTEYKYIVKRKIVR